MDPSLPPLAELQSMLFDACRAGDDAAVGALVRAGADIEGRNAQGHTPLVLASYNGHAGTTALLLDLGAAPDGQADRAGNTALMGVAFKGYLPIAQLLIARGADVNARNGAGQTALMTAALFGHAAIIELLRGHGADPALTDAMGNTARSIAAAQGNVVVAALLD